MIWLILVILSLYIVYRFIYFPSHQHDKEDKTANSETLDIPPVPVPRTRTFSSREQIVGMVESVNWCNDIAKICWPQIGKIIEAHLKPTLEPLINLYLPKPFSKFRFIKASLGRDPITVNSVTVHRRFKDSIALDLNVTYKGHPSIAMKCAPLGAGFGIKELRWTGRISVLLRPLLTTLPLIGAIQAAMINHPDLDMDFTGVANIAEFGPVERIVKMVLRNVIAAMIVLPNRIMYKFSENVDYFNVYEQPIGIIDVKIERGRGFTKERKIGMIKAIPDLYCLATFALEEIKTDVQMNNLNPEWGKSKSFILSDLDQPFHLDCYDKDTISRDDLVGSFTVTAKDLLQKQSDWYPLVDNIDEKIASNGEIYVTTQLHRFRGPKERVRGPCVMSILIDRAKNLPPTTKKSACKVTVGSMRRRIVRETPQISRPKKQTLGMDPVNPIWNFSFDILCDDHSTSDVTLEVFSGKHTIGQVVINARDLEASDTKTKQGTFSIGGNATLRAKVILRGLEPKIYPPIEELEDSS